MFSVRSALRISVASATVSPLKFANTIVAASFAMPRTFATTSSFFFLVIAILIFFGQEKCPYYRAQDRHLGRRSLLEHYLLPLGDLRSSAPMRERLLRMRHRVKVVVLRP